MTPTAPSTLDAGTRLAAQRTLLAFERTQMAWVRTSASLISFGFTIYKFFDFEAQKGAAEAHRLLSPREFGMVLILSGLVTLGLGAYGHFESLKQLHEEFGTSRRSVAGMVSWLMAVMGSAALLVTWYHG